MPCDPCILLATYCTVLCCAAIYNRYCTTCVCQRYFISQYFDLNKYKVESQNKLNGLLISGLHVGCCDVSQVPGAHLAGQSRGLKDRLFTCGPDSVPLVLLHYVFCQTSLIIWYRIACILVGYWLCLPFYFFLLFFFFFFFQFQCRLQLSMLSYFLSVVSVKVHVFCAVLFYQSYWNFSIYFSCLFIEMIFVFMNIVSVCNSGERQLSVEVLVGYTSV